MAKMLLSQCFAATVCHYVVLSNLDGASAGMQQIIAIGKEPTPYNRKELEEKTIHVQTSNTSNVDALFTFTGNNFNTISMMYVSKADSKANIDEDLFVGVVGGGIKRNFATVEVIARPNPANEKLTFAVQLIH